MALSAGFLIQGFNTAYADDLDDATAEANAYIDQFMWHEEDYDQMQKDIERAEKEGTWTVTYTYTNEPSEDKYTDYDYRSIDKVRTVIDERDALIAKFNYLKKQFTEIEEKTTVTPSPEEKSQAQAQWDKGAVGFYEAMGSSEAIDVFEKLPAKPGYGYSPSTGAKYLGANVIGSKISKEDSRNLDSMKNSINDLRVVNEKRQKDGGIDGKKLSVFGISDFDMAVAQANANYSSNVMGHASVYNPPYENLFWAGGSFTAEDAVRGWWDDEKVLFDYLRSLGLRNRDEMQEYMSIHKDELTPKFKYLKIGHYTNLVDDLMWGYEWSPKDTISAGYANKKSSTSMYPTTISIVMNPEAPTNRTVYSIDDYEKRFMEYYTDLNSIVKDNKKIVDKSGLSEMSRLKGEMSGIQGQIDKVEKNLRVLKNENRVYLELRDTIKDNKLTVEATKFLMQHSPKKIAHVRSVLVDLMNESEAICRESEALLMKAGVYFN